MQVARAQAHAADVGGINTVLGWATWIAFGICVLSLIVAGVRMGLGHRHEGQRHVDRIGVVLVATIIVSAAVGLVTAIAPSAGAFQVPKRFRRRLSIGMLSSIPAA